MKKSFHFKSIVLGGAVRNRDIQSTDCIFMARNCLKLCWILMWRKMIISINLTHVCMCACWMTHELCGIHLIDFNSFMQIVNHKWHSMIRMKSTYNAISLIKCVVSKFIAWKSHLIPICNSKQFEQSEGTTNSCVLLKPTIATLHHSKIDSKRNRLFCTTQQQYMKWFFYFVVA